MTEKLEESGHSCLLVGNSKKADTIVNTQFDDATKPLPPPEAALPQVSISSAKKRVVRCIWPRDPKGPAMDAGQVVPHGKVAGNKQRNWGATLNDFYWVQRTPEALSVLTKMSGSRLAAWMKQIGEVEHAREEIEWAEKEDQPREIFPCDIGRLLEDRDPGILTLRPLEHLSVYSPTESDDEKIPSQPNQSENEAYTFQQRIPFHLLPKKLIVHDEGGTLRVSKGDPPFDLSPPKTIHVYRLHLLSHAEERSRRQCAAVQKEYAAARSEVGMLFDSASLKPSSPSPTCCPDSEAIFAKYPKEPEPPLSTPEAHLYLSSKRVIGRGHHSTVYRAEWEVPRTWLPSFRPRVCERCASLALLEKLKKDMPDVEVDETEYVRDQILTFLKESARRSAAAGFLGDDTIKTKMRRGTSVRQIDIDVQWQCPGMYCEHENHGSNKTTFRTLVSAKLSFKHDDQLRHEAKNYQKFPAHFFQHWNGYNIVNPLHDPTPIGAVVPQFYGYYVPEKGDDEEEYLSPILLLEDCGLPIDVEDLDIDDRQECASLLFRFHNAGWLHESVYARNIVMQHGDIQDWPAYKRHSDRRFRLIDFGRSERLEKEDTTEESWAAQKLLMVGKYERIGRLGKSSMR
ncbi:hypothetical protein IW261DRAFT_1421096 [Armillaria novae-zelandiae]|uniref:Protein kinase domain-containing protein n=1 Tax=Armillaria novae-zelandiae TaxID=153914 RepID=A0AA39P4Y4_9AGAR|nr:hypothetical protein IW261DRAFT_1421096 [Armillaria novae-zelandiae]